MERFIVGVLTQPLFLGICCILHAIRVVWYQSILQRRGAAATMVTSCWTCSVFLASPMAAGYLLHWVKKINSNSVFNRLQCLLSQAGLPDPAPGRGAWQTLCALVGSDLLCSKQQAFCSASFSRYLLSRGQTWTTVRSDTRAFQQP